MQRDVVNPNAVQKRSRLAFAVCYFLLTTAVWILGDPVSLYPPKISMRLAAVALAAPWSVFEGVFEFIGPGPFATAICFAYIPACAFVNAHLFYARLEAIRDPGPRLQRWTSRITYVLIAAPVSLVVLTMFSFHDQRHTGSWSALFTGILVEVVGSPLGAAGVGFSFYLFAQRERRRKLWGVLLLAVSLVSQRSWLLTLIGSWLASLVGDVPPIQN